jgi:S-adenosylmethionine hydrolase
VAVGAVEIEGLSRCYAEVEEGAPVALINSFGYLEIAVNRGNAARSLGVSKEEEITLRYRSS